MSAITLMASNSSFPAQASKKRKAAPSWETIQGLIEAVPEEADSEELKTVVSSFNVEVFIGGAK